MRVLLLHDEIYPNTSANARIVYRIVDELLTHSDVEVTIVARAQTQEQFSPNYKSAKVVHGPWLNALKYSQLIQKLGRWKFLRYILFPHSIAYRLYHKQLREPYQVEFLLWTYKHRHEFDVVLACSMPEYTVAIAAMISKYLPVVYYYMEPLLRMTDQRKVWDTKATKIILPSIYASTTLGENNRKNVLAEFCNIVERPVVATAQLATTYDFNLAFVGKFYPTVRHPQYVFDIIEQLQSRGKYGLHVAGGFNGPFPKPFIDKYFTNALPWLHYYGFVQPDVADSYLLQSDVLVHIANKTSSQMPSKILDYIATGKPILNFYYNDDCPTLPVLKQYSMALNVKMEEPITDELINQIVDFCTKYKGITIPFSQIEKQYEQYTPKYVGKIFYDTLHAAINEN
ncbi:MAG: glycosyltransferase [Prevotellaceae bacterium]|nr:glycosyltransferase [Candidatus Faecinaster equi]